MKKELDELLCQRYPLIFADRRRSIKESCMGWGEPPRLSRRPVGLS